MYCVPPKPVATYGDNPIVFIVHAGLLYLLEYGSTPAVGSSRKIILGSPMRAIPTDSLRFC